MSLIKLGFDSNFETEEEYQNIKINSDPNLTDTNVENRNLNLDLFDDTVTSSNEDELL